MKGDKEVLKHLQAVLTQELTSINQYFLHYGMQRNWGYIRLAKISREESVDEMRHAEWVLDRMLHLEGVPDMTSLDPLRVGKNVKQQIENDLKLELDAVRGLNQAIAVAMKAGDNTTRELLERILHAEEEHVEFLKAQQHQIGEMGYERYLSEQMDGEEG
jgi:bacterioferritin